MAVSKLLTIEHQEIFNVIVSKIMSKVNEAFRNKRRYHEHSYLHKLLATSLQHLLFIFSIRSKLMDIEEIIHWSVELFDKLPHQNDVKLYLEWLITLYLLKVIIIIVIF